MALFLIEIPDNTAAILDVLSFGKADACDSLFWRNDNNKIRFLMECSDTFYWASADCEPIEEGDEILLRSCYEDLKSFKETYLIGELFASRKRGMRPMSLWLGTRGDRKPWQSLQLFLDAGPERDPKDEG